MNAFLHIMIYNIFPLLLLSGIGYWLDSKFKMDVKTFTKTTFYFVLPAFIFRSIYRMPDMPGMTFLLLAGIMLFILHSLVATFVSRWRGFDPGKTEAFRIATMFTNCGNVGVTMITLIYSRPPFVHDNTEPYFVGAMAAITMLLILTNVTLNTLGLFLAGRGRLTGRDAFLMIMHMPTVYMLATVLFIRYMGWPAHEWFVWPVIDTAAKALPLLAMLTLGMQLHRTTLYWFDFDVWLTIFCRLILGPLFALAIIYGYGKFEPLTAQVFFIFASVPSAVNSVMFAVEFNNHPGYATQAVMLSFVTSSFTLPAAIYLAQVLFPLPTW